MKMLTKMKRNMEIEQIIDETLFRYYSNKGMKVPNWKVSKDPQWWRNYLIDLGLDPNNP